MNPIRKLLRNARKGASNGADQTNGEAGVPVVALVGHCGPDSFSLKRFVKSAVEGVRLMSVSSDAALVEALEQADALLVNRQLDGRFGTRSGVALVARIRAERAGEAPALILISNYADAQQQAQQAGAMPGFGKADLRKVEAAQRLRAALGETRQLSRSR